MKALLSLFLKFLFLLGIISLHFFVSSVFPFPFNTVNIIFSVLILHILFFGKGKVIWMAFFIYFCIELYTTSPFGVFLFSGMLSIIAIYWLSRYFFALKSWYSTFFLTFFALTIFHVLFSFSMFIISLLYDQPFLFSWKEIITLSFLEIISTEVVVLLGFLIIPKIQKKLFPFKKTYRV